MATYQAMFGTQSLSAVQLFLINRDSHLALVDPCPYLVPIYFFGECLIKICRVLIIYCYHPAGFSFFPRPSRIEISEWGMDT